MITSGFANLTWGVLELVLLLGHLHCHSILSATTIVFNPLRSYLQDGACIVTVVIVCYFAPMVHQDYLAFPHSVSWNQRLLLWSHLPCGGQKMSSVTIPIYNYLTPLHLQNATVHNNFIHYNLVIIISVRAIEANGCSGANSFFS